MKNCEFCNTPIEIDLENGRVMRFTAHTDEYCKHSALNVLRVTQALAKQHALEAALAHKELRELARTVDAIDRRCQQARDDGYLNDAIQDISRIIHPPTPTAEDIATSQALHAERLRQAQAIGLSTVPKVDRGDLFHSQGIEVAEILNATPLARACAVCASAIGQACIEVPNPEYPLVNLNGCICHEARAVTPVIT